jgi:hypothetical protein
VSDAFINSSGSAADSSTVHTEHDALLRANADLHAELSRRTEEVAADERAATIFTSVEELYVAYEDSEPDEVSIATLRQVNWGFRTVTALLDDEEPPALFRIQEPLRGAYTRTLIVAGSFGLLVAVLLYEFIVSS